MTVVACDQLSRTIDGRNVVQNVSFAVPSGAAFGLLGPNGSGKTTTVRLLTGLLTPTSGTVSLFGEPLTPGSSDRLRERIGVQTDTNLYELLTVRDNLAIWADIYGMSPAKRDTRIAEVLETFDLQDRTTSPVGTLSKGMRQKLAIARAILHQPDLLFLDEPTAGLDPEASEDLIAYLRAMIDRTQTTVVICTHQLFGLERLCTHVGLLDRGRLLRSGPVETLLAETWPTTRVRIEVTGDPVAAIQVLARHDISATNSAETITVELPTAELVPQVVQHLVAAGQGIRSVVPVVPTIHDLYFATIVPERAP